MNEEAGKVVFDISLSRPAPTDFSVCYRMIDGTARGGSDYRATTGTVSFVEGQSIAQVAIGLFSNRSIQDTETFTLAFGSTSRLGAVTSVEARILDGSIQGSALGEELRGTPGNDAIYGFGGDDFIYAAGRADYVSGRTGDDTVRGGRGNDMISGGNGADRIYGGDGADRMVGADGKDLLTGAEGRDAMSGGDAADRFVFKCVKDSKVGWQRDVITDFDKSEDWIDLRSIVADTRGCGDQDFDFIGRSGFTRDVGEIRFRDGILSGDVDGDGKADFDVALTDVTSLADNHFIL